MAKFRKKPVVIEAFQMTKERRWDNNEWPNWLNEAWQKTWPEPGAVASVNTNVSRTEAEKLSISTLEGALRVEWNDWIIQGVQGELYPCKPDIFEATYEPVLEDGDQPDFVAEIAAVPGAPQNEYMAQFFKFEHLPDELQAVSRPFADLADLIIHNLPRNPERTVALRKLLEAKDCAVRAKLSRD